MGANPSYLLTTAASNKLQSPSELPFPYYKMRIITVARSYRVVVKMNGMYVVA